jgi:hypothetical protein
VARQVGGTTAASRKSNVKIAALTAAEYHTICLASGGLHSGQYGGEEAFKGAALQDEGESEMIDVIFPKRAPSPRERDSRPIPNDYRPKQMRALGSVADSDGYFEDLGGTFLDGSAIMHKLEDELNRNRLNDIAALVRSLTYGEMMELAQAIWKIRPEGTATVDQHALPMMLHLWSTASSPDAEPADRKAPDVKAAE